MRYPRRLPEQLHLQYDKYVLLGHKRFIKLYPVVWKVLSKYLD